MDRGKSTISKKPAKGKASLPPGDLFALGSKPSRPGDLKSASGSSGDKKLSSFGDRKRDSSSLLAPGAASKKPKILGAGQTFTPLGRPSDRDADRRSPLPTVSHAFEETAIEVDNVVLLTEVLAAEESDDMDRVEGLLCGAVKYLHSNRSKPDNIVFLTLMHLAKFKASIFNSDVIIEAFCSLLKRDMSLNFKSKGNCLVSVLGCNVLMAAYDEEDNWPEEFVKVYVDDALGERIWVDRHDCKGFVDNILTAFNTNVPKGGLSSSLDVKPDQGSASPQVQISEDDDNKMEVDTEKSASLLAEQQTVPIFPRYPYQTESIKCFVMEIIREQLIKRQLMDASAKSLIKLMTATCGYSEVRQLAGQKLELWLQNPKLARASQELLMSVCMNCNQHDTSDLEVIAMLIKMRMKTKPLINHYLACIRELLNQHAENLHMVLTHTIYNELSPTRNPNNMSLIAAVFQTKSEQAAQILAEIFQDLLTNKDDYLRALRALLREIVRTLRHDINFAAFCLALMQNRAEAKFTDMEAAFKERYMSAVTDLVTMCMLQAITPTVREAVSSLARGDKKDVEVVYKYQNLVATIQRDCVWWLHTIVPEFIEPKQSDYIFCMKKVLFMESAEHYTKDNWPAEADKGSMLRLTTECPVLEDTLMRILVIGLSRDLALPPSDAIEFTDALIKRAANLMSEGRQVLSVERLELFDALLNLCAYRHPENIALPSGYSPPQLAISALYWKAWIILLIISAFNPSTFGLSAWDNYPTLKCIIEMVMTNNYKFPPPTTAVDDSVIEEIRSKEIQVAQTEKQQILEFEGYLAANTTKVTITEGNSLLIAQLTTMDPNGAARKPPQVVIDQLRSLNDSLKIGQMLCRSRKPDFLLDIIQRQGTSQSMPWLAELVESSEGSLDMLPVQCLCEFLLHETQDSVREGQDDESAKFERHKKKQKIKKQQQLLSRLQALVHDETTDSNTTHEVMDYFLKRLASTQASNRALATKGMSMIISRSQLSPTEEGPANLASEVEHNWLLNHLPKLPMFTQVKQKVCNALRQAIQIEADTSLISAYIMFLSQHSTDLVLQELDKLAFDIAQLIVERTTIITSILPQESGRLPVKMGLDTLEALITLFLSYVRKAKEPNTAGYTWSNTQDQIRLQWENGESATMHILVVHAMIIMLSHGPAHDKEKYLELLETWFPEKSKSPSAFLLDTSEEALLHPDWLKLRMIRSSSESLIAAALQDLDPTQLLLFVQSFGIPVHSMSRLLQCLDTAVSQDVTSLEQVVIDKAYMAQLIEVQNKRGAKGGEQFYSMLTNGGKLGAKKEESEMDTQSSDGTMWQCQGQADVTMETLPTQQTINLLVQAFDPSGRSSPNTDVAYRTLVTSVGKGARGASSVVEALNQILSSPSAAEFGKYFISSTNGCSLLRLVLAKQKTAADTSQSLHTVMDKLSACCKDQKTPMAVLVHEYLKAKTLRKTQAINVSKGKQLLQDISGHREGSCEIERQISHSMRSAVLSKDITTAVSTACNGLLAWQQSAANSSGMQVSTAALFVDWLELLDSECIRLVPELQEKLLFCKHVVKQSSGSRDQSSQPYLLALLTHQSSWDTLHRCIHSLLTDSNKGYDPVSVLDFLWACTHIPKLWQGRERKISKNISPEDVLGLNASQLLVLISYIIEEATSLSQKSHDQNSTNQNQPQKPHDPNSTNQNQAQKSHDPNSTNQTQASDSSANEIPASIRSRMELLKSCVSGNEDKVKVLVNHVESRMNADKASRHLYQGLLLELYLQYPYILAWISDTRSVTSHAHISLKTETQMDLITHRLITGLYQGNKNKRNDNKMADVNIACRKLAAQHPILLLRQLPAIIALLKGKTQFTFAQFRQRNLMSLYTYILGILELLKPSIFNREHTSLNDILEEYFNLLTEYFNLLTAYHGAVQKLMAPIIVKLVHFLNDYVTHDPHRATSLLQKHALLLSNVSSLFPELSLLKSLIAGLTIPRQGEGEVTPLEGSSNSTALYSSRPSSPWSATSLAPFAQRMKNNKNSDDVLAVLQDLDETSKRKIDVLGHFVEDLKRLMSAFNDQCRNTAFELTKRHLKHNPKNAVEFVPTFLHCLESGNPDIVTSALTNLAEFTLLCQDYADVILQRALSAGINTSIETSSYISESLQLLNLDLASG